MSPVDKIRRKVPAITLPGLVNPEELAADRQFAQNLARGLEVLRAFTAASPELSNAELSARTKLPRPTISRLTYTLTLLGFLSRDDATQKYRLGIGVLSLGHPLLANLPVRQLARPIMQALALRARCTVNLGIRDRANVVYIESVRVDPANADLPDIGSAFPLLPTAIGQALLMGYSLPERAAILNYLKVRDRGMYDTHAHLWRDAQAHFAGKGYTRAHGCFRPGIHAVAVPVRLKPGESPIAMNCTVTEPRPNDRWAGEVAPLLADAARQVEAVFVR